MGTLLKLHLFRVKKDIVLHVFFFIVLGISIFETLFFFIGNSLMNIGGGTDINLFSNIDPIMSFFQRTGTSIILLIVGLIVFINRELSYGTLRNQVVSGYSKFQIYCSYIFLSLIVGGVFLLSYQIVGLILALILRFPNGFNSTLTGVFNGVNSFFIRYLCSLLLYLLFIVFLVSTIMAFRNLAISLVLLIALPTVMVVIISVISPISFIFPESTQQIIKQLFGFIPYYQGSVISSFDAVSALLRETESSTGMTSLFSIDTPIIVKTLITSPCYGALLFFVGYAIFKRKDLK